MYYECRKCKKRFNTKTEWKTHEFDCRNYIALQTIELENVKSYYKNETNEFNYEVKPMEFIDTDNLLHKVVHFQIHIKFKDYTIHICDADGDLLDIGAVNKSHIIIKHIEQKKSEIRNYTEEEKLMYQYYSGLWNK